VVETREPGGTPLGESLRAILLETEPGGMSLASEALLFAASRAELVRRVVRPALAEGRWVVSDRFLDSSLAYQGAARGLGIDAVAAMNAPAVDGSRPDRTIVVDVPVDVAAGRRSAGPDRIEAEGAGFQQAVAAGYRLLAEREPERISLVDGQGTPEAVHARVLEALGLDER
jgi:dTMP kinase